MDIICQAKSGTFFIALNCMFALNIFEEHRFFNSLLCVLYPDGSQRQYGKTIFLTQLTVLFQSFSTFSSGMGKTAVFVLATLHLLNPVAGEVHVVVLCHTRELAFQIQKEYERFSKYLPDIKSRVFYGGKAPWRF